MSTVAAIPRPHAHLTGRMWVGVNYWSAPGPETWHRFDRHRVAAELDALAARGCTAIRMFALLGDVLPADKVDGEVLGRLAITCDLAGEAGLVVLPTLLTGHMSGQNHLPAWYEGGDWYRDVCLLERQERIVTALVDALRDRPAVAGWVISNEIPLFAGSTDRTTADAWARRMVAAVRASDPTRPVLLGDGAWGPETSGTDNGFRVADVAEITDAVAPHVYPEESAVVRQHLHPAFVCELAHVGRPVVLEEFGVSSSFTADDHAADYYRQVLWSSLAAGASGWLAWNNTDFDLPDRDPYRHHPFEQRFGLLRTDGSAKPAFEELTAFSHTVQALGAQQIRRAPSSVALLVSSYLGPDHPFTHAADRAALGQGLFQGYVVARAAGLAPAVVHETDGVPPDAATILVPCTRQLTAPTWQALEDAAHDGATVYVSYTPGAAPVQRGFWHADPDAFFGIHHRTRFAGVHRIDAGTLPVAYGRDDLTDALGDVRGLPVDGTESHRRILPVEATEAEIVALDDADRPILLERRVGTGRIVLATLPLELMVGEVSDGAPVALVRLYRWLAGAPHDPTSEGMLVDDLDTAIGPVELLLDLTGRERSVPVGGDVLFQSPAAPADRLPGYGVQLRRRGTPTPDE